MAPTKRQHDLTDERLEMNPMAIGNEHDGGNEPASAGTNRHRTDEVQERDRYRLRV